MTSDVYPASDYIKVLSQFRQYWQFSPFQLPDPDWPDELKHDLARLSSKDVAAMSASVDLQQQFFHAYFPDLYALPLVTEQGKAAVEPPPFWLSNGMSGRKLAQITAFIAQLPVVEESCVEWCSGKGHLGRVLAFNHNRHVTSLEWQQSLCREGAQLAAQHHLNQQFIQADVLNDDLKPLLQQAEHALALHACGDLHIELMRQGASCGLARMTIAPCCYHLIQAAQYNGISTAVQQHLQATNLQLKRADLKLAVQGQVTAGARIEKLRHIEITWRLAYHALYQSMTGERHYRPLRSVAKSIFTSSFPEFAQWASAQHQLQLPQHLDWSAYLAKGQLAAKNVAKLELVRQLFRRPLETLLVLDRALYLNEQGYHTQVLEFCDYQLTPRNFLIRAWR